LVVHDAGQAGDVRGAGDTLVLRLVGQHRTGNGVADRPDAGNIGAAMMVGLDLTALVELEADVIETTAFAIRPAADRNEDAISLDCFRSPAFRGFHSQRRLAALDVNLGDLGAELELDALLLEDLVGFLADVAVHAGQDLVEEFDAGHLRAEPPPDRA